MGVWESYSDRLGISGEDWRRSRDILHDVRQERMRDRFRRKVTASMAWQEMEVESNNSGLNRRIHVAVTEAKYPYLKNIFMTPGEDLPHGEVLVWNGARWLVTTANYRQDLSMSGQMQQCNYYARWINEEGNIVGRWACIENGTYHMTGELFKQTMVVGNARQLMTMGKDRETVRISRGRRFLVDADGVGEDCMAYIVTQSDKLKSVYNGRGAMWFFLSEDNLTDNDNVDLRIADYYSWHPRHHASVPDPRASNTGIVFEPMVDKFRKRDADIPAERESTGVWL